MTTHNGQGSAIFEVMEFFGNGDLFFGGDAEGTINRTGSPDADPRDRASHAPAAARPTVPSILT